MDFDKDLPHIKLHILEMLWGESTTESPGISDSTHRLMRVTVTGPNLRSMRALGVRWCLFVMGPSVDY
jgi:hypothetical protein